MIHTGSILRNQVHTGLGWRVPGLEKVGKLIDRPKGLLIVNANLDGLSLVNHV